MAQGDAGNQGMGAGEPGIEAAARAQLERLDSLLRRIQVLRRKYAAAIECDAPPPSGDADALPQDGEAEPQVEAAEEEPRPASESDSASEVDSDSESDSDWKQRYVSAMEAVHAPGGGRPARVRNRTDPIVPGSPGFRREES